MTETTRKKWPWSLRLSVFLVGVALLVGLAMMTPLSVNVLMRGTLADVDRAFVLAHPNIWDVESRSASVDATPEEREELLDLLGALSVRWTNYSSTKRHRTDEHLYTLTLAGTPDGTYAELIDLTVDESGNLYIGNFQFAGDTGELVPLIQKIWNA